MIKADIASWKNWADGTSYPVLTLQATKDSTPIELEALRQLHHATLGLGGKIENSLASLQSKDQLKVDLSGLLFIVAKSNHDKIKNAWVTQWLKNTIKPEWVNSKKIDLSGTKKVVFSCRCGYIANKKKKIIQHRLHCVVLKSLSGVSQRCPSVMERVMQDVKGEKQRHTGKTGKGKSIQRKAAGSHVNGSSRAEVRRTKRNSSGKKKRS